MKYYILMKEFLSYSENFIQNSKLILNWSGGPQEWERLSKIGHINNEHFV